MPSQVKEVKDKLYRRFWNYVENNDVPDTGERGARVELDGYLRLLKKNGKLTNEFDLYGQRPIEIILLKVKTSRFIPENLGQFTSIGNIIPGSPTAGSRVSAFSDTTRPFRMANSYVDGKGPRSRLCAFRSLIAQSHHRIEP